MDIKLYQHLVESLTGKITSPEPFQTTAFHFPTLENSWKLKHNSQYEAHCLDEWRWLELGRVKAYNKFSFPLLKQIYTNYS